MHLETNTAQNIIKTNRTLTCPACRGESFKVVAGEMERCLDASVSDPKRPKEPVLGFQCRGCGERIVFVLPQLLGQPSSPDPQLN